MLRDLFSLFPAYAGVIPYALIGSALMLTFPRIRGGDPNMLEEIEDVSHFSPHTRG